MSPWRIHMIPLIPLTTTLQASFDDYREISHPNAIVTTTTSFTVPANSSVIKSSSQTVVGSTEPCNWRDYVNTIFDDAWTSTIVNQTNMPVTHVVPFRSGNASNTWELIASPHTRFTREATDWVYPSLARDPND